MRLPHATLGRVEETKITGYLLNRQHPQGASKARLFERLGFSAHDWRHLASALLEHGQTHPVSAIHTSPYGTRYEVDGELKTPANRRLWIRTVWQTDINAIAPRLITAYPLPRPRS